MFYPLTFSGPAIETAIKAAELRTTGEIRVCVERRACADSIARAGEVFQRLGMDKTPERNGVLLYIHVRNRSVAVVGDIGIDQKVPPLFWQQVCAAVTACFSRKDMSVGVVLGIMLIADELARLFPSRGIKNSNALPDTVVIGDSL